ncbi:MAG: FAD binding domain-containing protein [Ardenticatenales bacterium]|nr:FAD binding domain-containing protein [Ardenticatenales bacterium]
MKLYNQYFAPASVDEALALLAEHGERARVLAGGTDLIVELDRGVRHLDAIIDITRIMGLDHIEEEAGTITLGPLVTHNQAANDERVLARAFPLAQAAWEVGSPQLRNRGTVVGNLITASPANDTIPPLLALGARVVLGSAARGERTVSLDDFYTGFRKVDLSPDEMVLRIEIPALGEGERGAFAKLALRRAQAISVVNVAVMLRESGARITLGSVAATVIRAPAAEALLAQGPLTPQSIEEVARLTAEAATPIDDVRGTAEYRVQAVLVLARRLLQALHTGSERDSYPTERANLWERAAHPVSVAPAPTSLIESIINGQRVTMEGAAGKTLLRALREDAGLIGTKEGCSEGECGACTIWLDGVAVMSCLVPAERAHGATVTTIEGLSEGDTLHPLQQSFIKHDAVQCGYCTPGFIMSAAKLLEEKGTRFTDTEIRQAISGNLCRCTGYYKIIEAIQALRQPTDDTLPPD